MHAVTKSAKRGLKQGDASWRSQRKADREQDHGKQAGAEEQHGDAVVARADDLQPRRKKSVIAERYTVASWQGVSILIDAAGGASRSSDAKNAELP